MTHGVGLGREGTVKVSGDVPYDPQGRGLIYKLAVIVFSVAFVAPNLWAIVSPYEDWPYTSLPMYAHYVDQDTPRYRFIFVGEFADGGEEEVTAYSVGVDYAAMRFFLMYVYGSVETAASPFNRFPNDDRAAFEDRLSRFFGAYAWRYADRFPERPLRGIRLQVAQLQWPDNDVGEVHEIGRHDVAAGRFIHSWRAQ